jgi:hypothetical protein
LTSPTPKLQRIATAIAMTLMLVALWLIMHRYPGIVNDAQIYAFQALARLRPALRSDLYLQNTSQDAYTVFSPFYACAIAAFGLNRATLGLTVLFIVGFLAASWALARRLFAGEVAWLAVAALIIVSGAYGASGVFQFTDNFLTPRMPAEALIVTALVCHLSGWKRLGLLIAAGAVGIHPLMAFPGLLVLLTLWLPRGMALLGAAIGIVATVGVAVAARIRPEAAGITAVMDRAWLEVVRERSGFLFLDSWSASDWKLNAQPFVALALAACVFREERVRQLILGALLVAAAGLIVALIAALVAPIAILVQGQAWRWLWVADFLSILLLAPMVLRIRRDPICGPICAILLVAGRTVSSVDGTACAAIALVLWVARPHFTGRSPLVIRWAGYVAGVVVVGWVAAVAWTIFGSTAAGGAPVPLFGRIRDIFGLGPPAVVLVALLWGWVRQRRSVLGPAIVATLALAVLIYLAPISLGQANPVGSAPQLAEFLDWRSEIPPTGSVFLADRYDTGAFVWFLLERPNYLSIDQSAGVVFSRTTALEVRRRSEVVLPLMDRDWELETHRRRVRAAAQPGEPSRYRPLTAANLVSVCSDPLLGFVIAHENVGFDPVRHTHDGPWKDWNLYDCRRVRGVMAR